MFGIIADFLASIITILLPVFASYKALRASDPAQLTPWLIYWVILSLILLIESWTVFILGWLPFYSWIRLFALSYLVLPQTQGAKLLYTNYVEPFITNHERQIETFIGDLHEKGNKAGLGYLKQLIDLIRQRLLGLPPTREDSTPAPPTAAGYAQSLLSRFAMPTARAPSTSDFYTMLSGAVAAATTSSAPSSTTTRSEPLIPPTLTNQADKQTFLTTQRSKLAFLLKALDREQRDLDLAYGTDAPRSTSERSMEADVGRRMMMMRDPSTGGSATHDADMDTDTGMSGMEMRKNRSDNSFQNIEREDVGDDDGEDSAEAEQRRRKKRQSAGMGTTSGGGGGGGGGSWNPAAWFTGGGGGGGGGGDDSSLAGETLKDVKDAVQGMSSGVDRRR